MSHPLGQGLVSETRAESNIQEICVSDPKDGVPKYGLTEKGKQQAIEACTKLESLLQTKANDNLSEKLIIVSSDFKRTRETAEILHDHFKVKTPLRLETALRERGCGDLHYKPVVETFEKIFRLDYADPTHTEHNCESLMNCVMRMARIVGSVNDEYENKIIVLVSHGDPLHCLWAVVSGVPPIERWSDAFPWFGNCDLREIPSQSVQ